MANRYARRKIGDEVAYEKKLQVTRDYMRPDMEVMEFGCGTGATALAHAPYVRYIRAIDFSHAMIEIARRRAAEARVENVRFEQAAIDDFAAPDGAFDMVMGHSVLHLVEDRDAVIAKVHKLLKPGGVFVSNTACLGDTMRFFKLIGPVGRLIGVIPMVKVFTRQGLIASLTSAGFSIERQWQPGRGKAVFAIARK